MPENPENGTIPINKGFHFITTCNIKKIEELSPALLNRFFVLSVDDQLIDLNDEGLENIIEIIMAKDIRNLSKKGEKEKEDKGKEKEDKEKDKEDKGKDKEDKGKDKEDKGKEKEDKKKTKRTKKKIKLIKKKKMVIIIIITITIMIKMIKKKRRKKTKRKG